ncbi:MAG: cytochrome c [Gammaproteobacteria bacterium]|nr:cytochrome c [Gammaproteobacteria bacterium]
MKFTSKLFLILAGLALSAPGIADEDPNLKLLKARQGEMQLRSFNVGPLFGMAKGKMDYNAELASKLANNLKTQLDLDMGRAWKQGTANDAYPGKTTALPEIWTTYPEIADYGKKYAKAINELAAVAGNGADALKSKMGAVGKSCKGCHDEFREKQ